MASRSIIFRKDKVPLPKPVRVTEA